MTQEKKRLARQFAAIARAIPPARRAIEAVTSGRLRRWRIPLAVLLILGGLLSFLPVLGLWMLPLGLLLLALDVPPLRPHVSAAVIRSRRRLDLWRRRLAGRG